MSKYNAKRTIIDGIAFASRLEAAVYSHFRELEKQGQCEIRQLQAQVVLKVYYGDDANRAHLVRYKPDMLIMRNGEMVFIEAKGVETQIWRIKRAAWKLSGPARLEVWKGRSNRDGSYKVWCHEVLVPPNV